jgi:hypothetical protein
MKINDIIGPLRHVAQESPLPVSPESPLERVVRRVPGAIKVVPVSGAASRLLKSGAAAGATVMALSAANAVTSAVRRRQSAA